MKRTIGITLIFAVLSLSAGCTKQFTEQDALRRFDAETIFADFADNGTKTYLDQNRKLFWNTEDSISVFTTSLNRKFIFDGKTGDKEGSFTEAFDYDTEADSTINAIAAVYPYSSSYSLKDNGTKIYVQLPHEQVYAPGTFDSVASILYAYNSDSKSKSLSFNNLCGYLSVPIYGCGAVKEVYLEADVPISGTMSITLGSDKPGLDWTSLEKKNSIKMVCRDSVWVGSAEGDAKEFIFTLPPVALENGFTVKVVGTDGLIYQKSTTQARTIAANSFVRMSPWYIEHPQYQPFCYPGTTTPAIFMFKRNPFISVESPSENNPQVYTTARLDYFDNNGIRYGRFSGYDGGPLWNHYLPKHRDESIVDGPINFVWKDFDKAGQNQSITVDSCVVYSNSNVGNVSYHDTGNSYYDGQESFHLSLNYFSPTTTMGIFESLIDMVDATDTSFVVFGDTNFRHYCLQNFDSNGDFRLSYKEAAAVDTVIIEGTYQKKADVYSLSGIEHFTSLKYLSCTYCQIDSLDLSNNTGLVLLNCSYNQLKKLNVSKCTELDNLNCSNNQIPSLDASNSLKLRILYCDSNKLTTLDVSKNASLIFLNCDKNSLTALDVSKNTALTGLTCNNNQLTTLDVSKNTALTGLTCINNSLTTLDVSNNTALTSLNCNNNSLTALDVSKTIALTSLNCINNKLTALDVSKNTALTSLTCNNNSLTTLDVSNNTALTALTCNDNQLTALDASKNAALTSLNCENNKLTSLDVTNGSKIKTLRCSNNLISSIDISNCSALTSLYISKNALTTLSIGSNTKLNWLECEYNQLSVLDISANASLARVWCMQDGVLEIILTTKQYGKLNSLIKSYNKGENMTTFTVK